MEDGPVGRAALGQDAQAVGVGFAVVDLEWKAKGLGEFDVHLERLLLGGLPGIGRAEVVESALPYRHDGLAAGQLFDQGHGVGERVVAVPGVQAVREPVGAGLGDAAVQRRVVGVDRYRRGEPGVRLGQSHGRGERWDLAAARDGVPDARLLHAGQMPRDAALDRLGGRIGRPGSVPFVPSCVCGRGVQASRGLRFPGSRGALRLGGAGFAFVDSRRVVSVARHRQMRVVVDDRVGERRGDVGVDAPLLPSHGSLPIASDRSQAPAVFRASGAGVASSQRTGPPAGAGRGASGRHSVSPRRCSSSSTTDSSSLAKTGRGLAIGVPGTTALDSHGRTCE